MIADRIDQPTSLAGPLKTSRVCQATCSGRGIDSPTWGPLSGLSTRAMTMASEVALRPMKCLDTTTVGSLVNPIAPLSEKLVM